MFFTLSWSGLLISGSARILPFRQSSPALCRDYFDWDLLHGCCCLHQSDAFLLSLSVAPWLPLTPPCGAAAIWATCCVLKLLALLCVFPRASSCYIALNLHPSVCPQSELHVELEASWISAHSAGYLMAELVHLLIGLLGWALSHHCFMGIKLPSVPNFFKHPA